MIGRILFVSEVTPEAGSRLVSTLEDILIVSTSRNQADGLTGLVVCDGLTFAQVLEGPTLALEACWGRITQDPRHRALDLRAHDLIDARTFWRWSMCGLYLSPLDDALLRPPDLDVDPRRTSAGALLQRLSAVAQTYGRQLNAAHAHRLRPRAASGEGSERPRP